MNVLLDDHDGLVSWNAVNEWLADKPVPGEGPVLEALPVGGGSQNNVFRVRRNGGSFVLRRPPRHLRPNSNDVIVREAQVLRALDATDVPHPHLYAVCSDPSVIGASFSVIEVIDGFTPRGQLPQRYAEDPGWRRSMAFEIVDGAASLALIDPAVVGLSDLGRPEGWMDRQVDRWRGQLEGYQRLEGYRSRTLDGVDEIGSWLNAHLPVQPVAGLIHGDLQFANVMFAHDRPSLLAMIDWELSTLGDPMLDLGWILTSWVDPSDPPGHEPYVHPSADLPSREELIERYLGSTGRDLKDVDWFFALACFKLAILIEGTYARALSGLASMEVGERLHRNAVWFLAKARQLIGDS